MFCLFQPASRTQTNTQIHTQSGDGLNPSIPRKPQHRLKTSSKMAGILIWESHLCFLPHTLFFLFPLSPRCTFSYLYGPGHDLLHVHLLTLLTGEVLIQRPPTGIFWEDRDTRAAVIKGNQGDRWVDSSFHLKAILNLEYKKVCSQDKTVHRYKYSHSACLTHKPEQHGLFQCFADSAINLQR